MPPVYPGAIPVIPTDGSWTHDQVADEVEAIAGELGVNPRGAQTNVGTRIGVLSDRVTTVEGATSVAGVEIAAAQLTTSYSILANGSNTTFTDIGLSIAPAAQTRAYNVSFSATGIVSTNTSFTGPKYTQMMVRIIDSGATQVLEASTIPFILPVSGSGNYSAKVYIVGRVPANFAAVTWKVQARLAPTAPDANVTTAALQGGPALSAPVAGIGTLPMQLQAVTV